MLMFCGAVVLEFDWLSVNEVVIHDIFELSVCLLCLQ